MAEVAYHYKVFYIQTAIWSKHVLRAKQTHNLFHHSVVSYLSRKFTKILWKYSKQPIFFKHFQNMVIYLIKAKYCPDLGRREQLQGSDGLERAWMQITFMTGTLKLCSISAKDRETSTWVNEQILLFLSHVTQCKVVGSAVMWPARSSITVEQWINSDHLAGHLSLE